MASAFGKNNGEAVIARSVSDEAIHLSTRRLLDLLRYKPHLMVSWIASSFHFSQ